MVPRKREVMSLSDNKKLSLLWQEDVIVIFYTIAITVSGVIKISVTVDRHCRDVGEITVARKTSEQSRK